MSTRNPITRSLFAIALLAAACGEVITPDYRGTPIATVGGQLSADAAVQLPETVRLAAAWYPNWLTNGVATSPKSIITQEIAYRGSFPQRYTFDFYAPPPDEALVAAPPEAGIEARAAYGLLLAYEDRNGNGKLDVLPASGVGADRILGSSFDWQLEKPQAGPTGYSLFYVETKPENDARLAAEGLARGYNVMGMQAPVPLSTPIPIALTGAPTLALHVCEELFTNDGELHDPPCGIEIPEQPDPEPVDGPRFGGLVSITDGVGRVEAQLFTEEGLQITDATVSLGTTAIPYDFGAQQYLLPNAPLVPGSSVMLTARIGTAQRTVTVAIPGDFSIESPLEEAAATAGSTLSVEWTASAGAQFYGAELETGEFGSSRTSVSSATDTTLELDASYTGEATLTVYAAIIPETNFPEGFTARVGRSVEITIVP